MGQEKDVWRKQVRNIVISIIVGGVIVWFLLSRIDPRDIPRAISNIPPQNLAIAFLLYTSAVFFKAARFKTILRTGISLRQIFPIVSLYMFFANILPMRAGELSYMYLLKKQASTPGTKSFASLIIGGVADVAVILMATLIVGWRLWDDLAGGFSYFAYTLKQKLRTFIHTTSWDKLLLFAIILASIACFVTGFILYRRKNKAQQSLMHRYGSIVKSKVLEVVHELANVKFDMRLLGIVVLSIMIISFRFCTQWYLVWAMNLGINIWQFAFALFFSVLFSLIPIHGPAGFGTVEAPWVLALVYLDVPQEDAITSGFGLHIVITTFVIVLGIYSALDLRFLRNKL